MFEGVLYFAGPRSRWAGKVDEDEVIARFQTRWRWLARYLTVSLFMRLDERRCGYAILADGVTVEQYDPKSEHE